jgi:CRP/FNR family cyclic AMP-dependent transcriptional regulator
MADKFEIDKTSRAVSACMDTVVLFHSLGREDMQILAPCLELRSYQKGEILFREGEAGDFICFVCSGQIEIKKETKFKGKQVILAQISKGSFVGELSIIDGRPRFATAVAAADSQILILRRSDFQSLIENHPVIGSKLLRELARVLCLRLRGTTERLAAVL